MANIPQRVREKIQEVKEKRLKELDLSNDGNTDDKEKLTQIPAEVFDLEWLEVLSLSRNKITTVPEAIARLQNLTTLDLSHNQITTVPEAIARLQNLTTLSLSGNQITTVECNTHTNSAKFLCKHSYQQSPLYQRKTSSSTASCYSFWCGGLYFHKDITYCFAVKPKS
ncbi:MAG: leucine-rich repeat domain-containing protein [Heteroscytonema crispum UTEX LB 1556]